MTTQRRRDTGLELTVRRALFALGLRYRVDAPILGLRRRADILFVSARVAVFVDGCFWHACPLHVTWPAANAAWWRAKLLANRRRDRDTDRRLAAVGWKVVRVWEHEDALAATKTIARLVRLRQA